jgi:hypothetical protein
MAKHPSTKAIENGLAAQAAWRRGDGADDSLGAQVHEEASCPGGIGLRAADSRAVSARPTARGAQVGYEGPHHSLAQAADRQPSVLHPEPEVSRGTNEIADGGWGWRVAPSNQVLTEPFDEGTRDTRVLG